METKFQNNLFYYKFEGDEYLAGKEYSKLLLQRSFDINVIKSVNDDIWNFIKEKNGGIVYRLLKKRIIQWLKIIKRDYKDYILFQKGFADGFDVDIDFLLELDISIEVSGLFCTISAEKNQFYRILDTSLEHRNLLKKIFNEIHIIKINDYTIVSNPGYLCLHTVISDKFSFGTFANNFLDKKKYLQNELPFYIKLKKYYQDSKNETDFINFINAENKINYDVDIILQGKNKNYIIDVMNSKNNKESDNMLEKSDYSPIKTDDLFNLHKELPDFSRIFVVLFKDNKLYVNNSLINNELIEIKI